MRHRFQIWLAVILCWAAVLGAVPAAEPVQTAEGFVVPQPGMRFQFPRDHGSHPDFALEWWYITGHLTETNGVRYGFQATFFRRATPRTETPGSATPAFGDQQLHLAHMALLEVQTGRFRHQERIQREGWNASASVSGLDVRNGNWSLQMMEPMMSGGGSPMELRGGVRGEVAFRFRLEPVKPLVVFGTNGVSRKAVEPTAASHYLTFSRLRVSGELVLDGQRRSIQGEAWMDHEFSSSQLGRDQVGWDWASLQLRDGREVMAYRMRRSDGTTDPFSTLAWVDQKGAVSQVGSDRFGWETQGQWRSPTTGAVYPAAVVLTAEDPVDGRRRRFRIEPLVAAQELTGALGGIPYWEGACRVLDESGQEVGRAFLEMTGYAAPLQGRL